MRVVIVLPGVVAESERELRVTKKQKKGPIGSPAFKGQK
jgi:hypothetical protein